MSYLLPGWQPNPHLLQCYPLPFWAIAVLASRMHAGNGIWKLWQSGVTHRSPCLSGQSSAIALLLVACPNTSTSSAVWWCVGSFCGLLLWTWPALWPQVSVPVVFWILYHTHSAKALLTLHKPLPELGVLPLLVKVKSLFSLISHVFALF